MNNPIQYIYTMETKKGTYEILATSLLDLFNHVEKIKSRHCIYNDEIIYIKEKHSQYQGVI